jgi:hypothetical protein
MRRTAFVTYLFVRYAGAEWSSDRVAASDLKAWCKEHNVIQTGVADAEWLHAELRGRPIFDGFHGPMGDGPAVIRYEDWPASNVLGS